MPFLPVDQQILAAVISPLGASTEAVAALNDAMQIVVMPPTQLATPEQIQGICTAVLACDLMVLELSTAVGLEPGVVAVWQAAQEAGMPRAVLVTGLSGSLSRTLLAPPDFDDMVLLAHRLLGEDPVVVAMPVADDDQAAVTVLDLSTGRLGVGTASVMAERAHRRLTTRARLDLIHALVVHGHDDERALSLLAAVDVAEDDVDADIPVWQGCSQAMSTSSDAGSSGTTDTRDALGSQSSLELDVEREVVDLNSVVTEHARAGDFGLMVPLTADGASVALLVSLVAGVTASQSWDRLVAVDAHGQRSDGTCFFVVLRVTDEGSQSRVLLRGNGMLPLVAVAPMVVTRTAGEDFSPFRAWPTLLQEIAQQRESKPEVYPTVFETISQLLCEVGDVVAAQEIWVQPRYITED